MSGCFDCGKTISRRATRCRSCNAAYVARSEGTIEALRARMNDPATRAKLNVALACPEMRRRRTDSIRAALACPEVRKRRAISVRAAKLSHVHADYRDLYMSLRNYGTASERLSIVHAQMAKDGVAA